MAKKWDEFGRASAVEVAAVVSGLDDQFVPYEQFIIDHNVSGESLLKLKAQVRLF